MYTPNHGIGGLALPLPALHWLFSIVKKRGVGWGGAAVLNSYNFELETGHPSWLPQPVSPQTNAAGGG